MTTFQISQSKMWSLGTFKPSRLTPDDTDGLHSDGSPASRELGWWLWERLSRADPTPHWRAPAHQWSVFSDVNVQEWHQDGVVNDRNYLISWSNTVGTEIRDAAMRIYQGAPGEVICFDNQYFVHRPPKLSPEVALKRYFARCSVSGSEFIKAVPGVFALDLP